MDTHRLNPLDASWLLVESRDTPMHIAGLLPFTLPPDAPADFLRALMLELRSQRSFAAPWNYRLQGPVLRAAWPSWLEGDVDLEYHVRHSALPHPGGERELGQLVARLHSQPLDLSRPPWEFHLIEGLEGGRFAVYVKMHHSLDHSRTGGRRNLDSRWGCRGSRHQAHRHRGQPWRLHPGLAGGHPEAERHSHRGQVPVD